MKTKPTQEERDMQLHIEHFVLVLKGTNSNLNLG